MALAACVCVKVPNLPELAKALNPLIYKSRCDCVNKCHGSLCRSQLLVVAAVGAGVLGAAVGTVGAGVVGAGVAGVGAGVVGAGVVGGGVGAVGAGVVGGEGGQFPVH